MLLTGQAGTGKSFTLCEMTKWARLGGKALGITAMTGSAAVLIGGRTLHSFLGIGLGKKSAKELASWILRKAPHIARRVRALDVLIIEEVSMLEADLLDKISELLCILRGVSESMGGLQVLLLGDFTQLPPINGNYCFKSAVWPQLAIQVVELTQIMRQKDDDDFKQILEEVRWGNCSKTTLTRLRKLRSTKFSGGILPTVLFARNVDVDSINDKKYKELVDNGAQVASFGTQYSNDQARTWAASCKIPDALSLCIGAQIVITWNISTEEGLVNGTRGVITNFSEKGIFVALKDGRTVLIEYTTVTSEESKNVWITFMPVKLAWAITIHKSQGMTLDAVVLALGDVFEYGQAYTALSRVRNLASIRILSVDTDSFKTHPDVITFYGRA